MPRQISNLFDTIKIRVLPKPGVEMSQDRIRDLHLALAPVHATVQQDFNSRHDRFPCIDGGFTVVFHSRTNKPAMFFIIESHGFTPDPASLTEPKPAETVSPDTMPVAIPVAA